MLDNFLILHAVQVDVHARFAFVRPFGGKEHEIALSQEDLNLIDGPVLHQELYITHRPMSDRPMSDRRDVYLTVEGAGLVVRISRHGLVVTD
jgi:hypothetical protein